MSDASIERMSKREVEEQLEQLRAVCEQAAKVHDAASALCSEYEERLKAASVPPARDRRRKQS